MKVITMSQMCNDQSQEEFYSSCWWCGVRMGPVFSEEAAALNACCVNCNDLITMIKESILWMMRP